MSNRRRSDPDPIEEFILRSFEENFQRIRFESGHGLSPEVKEAAKRQVQAYWRRLKEVAESITDTEVRLNLPNQRSPKGRKFNIEGVVDIVRGEGRTVMYDLKTHDPEEVRKSILEYERQLNVYAHIWKNLRQQELDETAIIATRFPEEFNAVWDNPAALDQLLQEWKPIIETNVDTQRVQETVEEFARTVDAIEDGVYSPPDASSLGQKILRGRTFASGVCRNCDVRFSCGSYRKYVRTSKSRELPRYKDIYEDAGTETDRETRMDAGLDTTGPEA